MGMQISNSYANTYAYNIGNGKQTQTASNTETTQVNKYSSANQVEGAKTSNDEYIKSLQQKNPKLNILTGYGNGSAGSSNYPEKIDVTIAPGFLTKMASDPELAAKYEKNLADIPAACKWGESMIRSMTGDTVYEFRFYIDENGNMSAGSVSGPSQKKKEFERSRQRAQQQKDNFNKRLEEQKKSRKEEKEKSEKLLEKRRETKKAEATNSDDKMVILHRNMKIDETYKPFDHQI